MSNADNDRTGTRRYIGGCYVYGDVDYIAYALMGDGRIWWDVSPRVRDSYRNMARFRIAEGATVEDYL
jgi:hypothetical protein